MCLYLTLFPPFPQPIPHPSGDVPGHRGVKGMIADYSPPKWGCAGLRLMLKRATALFPTQVGMCRLILVVSKLENSIPHPSGDVPALPSSAGSVNAYSPPKWGCAVLTQEMLALRSPFPTQDHSNPTSPKTFLNRPIDSSLGFQAPFSHCFTVSWLTSTKSANSLRYSPIAIR